MLSSTQTTLRRPAESVAMAASVAAPVPVETCFGSEKVSPPSVERENMITLLPGAVSCHTTFIPSLESTAISGSNATPDDLETSRGAVKLAP